MHYSRHSFPVRPLIVRYLLRTSPSLPPLHGPSWSRLHRLICNPGLLFSSHRRFTMASSDPEKRAILIDEDKYDQFPSNERIPRRRVWHWVALCLGAIVVFSFGVTYRRCSTATSLFISHGVPQNHHARPGPASQAINSRSPANAQETTTATSSAAAPDRTVLKTFEVAQPVLMPGGPAESDGSTRHGEDYSPGLCTVLLMRHDFAWSYNAPFVGGSALSYLRIPSIRALTSSCYF